MPTDRNRCPFAVQVADLHADPPRPGPVWGFCVHTSGRGILTKARELGVDPIEAAIGYYASAAYSTHYLIGYDGATYQITADDRKVSHIGIESFERGAYLAGGWGTLRLSAAEAARWRAHDAEPELAPSAVARWAARWAPHASPQHLYPGASANDAFVGGELLPLAKADARGLLYTEAQHLALGRLVADVARRHGWRGWAASAFPNTRVLGHEDVDAFGRWDSGGGWDPGALRTKPRLDWSLVHLAAVNSDLVARLQELGHLP